MIAVAFDEENAVLDRPPHMTADECDPLPVWLGMASNIPLIISCYKMTAEELAEINRTGRVWLTVVGRGMPPVLLQGQNPFVPIPEES